LRLNLSRKSNMKNTKILKEYREKDIKNLSRERDSLRDKLATLRSDLAFRKLKNVRQILATRKQIAQISTILNEKVAEEIIKQEAAK